MITRAVLTVMLSSSWMLILLAGCSSDGGGGAGAPGPGAPKTNQIRITFQDNPFTQTPLADVIVAVYNEDKKTIRQTFTTSGDGAVLFDTPGGKATVTYAYKNFLNVYGGDKHLRTYVDMPPGDYTWYLDNYYRYDCTEADQAGDFRVDLTAMTMPQAGAVEVSHTVFIGLLPSASASDIVPLCHDQVFADGSIDLLALPLDAATLATVDLPYAVKAGLETWDGATVVINNLFNPLLFPFSAYQVGDLEITLFNKGLKYDVGGDVHVQATDLFLPDQFPADYYRFRFRTGAYLISRYFETLPIAGLALQQPDLDVTQPAYEAASNTVSWSSTGTLSPAVTAVQVHVIKNNIGPFYSLIDEWSIIAPDSGSVVVPELPSQVLDWFAPGKSFDATAVSLHVFSDIAYSQLLHANFHDLADLGDSVSVTVDIP